VGCKSGPSSRVFDVEIVAKTKRPTRAEKEGRLMPRKYSIEDEVVPEPTRAHDEGMHMSYEEEYPV